MRAVANRAKMLKFMQERHKIYLAKTAGKPPPWTKDPILREYKFTNVYREIDRVTIWIRENIREPYADHPYLWFMLCAARMINWPPSLAELIADQGAWPSAKGAWDWHCMVRVLEARMARKEQVFTGAYIVPNVGSPHSKAHMVAHNFLRPMFNMRHKIEPALHQRSLQFAHETLMQYHGFGGKGFMAYEVVSDLRYTRYLEDALDVSTWANAGPGAIRGLNRVAERDLRFRLKPQEANEEMQELLAWMQPRWEHSPKLEMREIEHQLCEFDKYQRVLLGEGRPRSKYPGGG
jgi:hypothetical protein